MATHVEIKQNKLSQLEPLFDLVDQMEGEQLKINDLWDTFDSLKDVWNSESYFIKDFQKFAPPRFEIVKIQKRGSFVSLLEEYSSVYNGI